MLDWLKPILGDAYTEEIDSKIAAEIGRGFVARADFNEVSTAKKKLEQDMATRDQQLEDLKKSTGDIDALKQQITTLQTQNADAKTAYEAELAKVKLDAAVEAALTAAGAKNNTAVKALLADFLKDAKLADDGTVKGLDGEIATMAKAEATAFLFNTGNGGAQFRGMAPGNPGGKTPPPEGKKPSEMSYDELCAYMEANPGVKLD